MKKNLLSIFGIIFLMVFPAVSIQLYSTGVKGSAASSAALFADPETTTVTVTITNIDLRTRSVTLKDQNGKIYQFTVDSSIDLSKFKVGQSVTATISTTYTTDKATRARFTKMQLLKLQ
jgi:Cu/Ag efflux protein CusF